MEQQQQDDVAGEGEQQQTKQEEEVMRGEPEIVRLIHMGETEAVLDLIRSGQQSSSSSPSPSPPFDPNYKAAGGWSLLHMAALGDMAEVVAALVDAGADVESEDHGGLRPVHYAVSWDAQVALVELVERRGARLDCTSKDQLFYLNKIIPVFVVGGRTPLHLAVDKGYHECTRILLEAGADVSVIDWSGRTAYDLAVNNNRFDLASLLRPDVTEHVSAVPKDFHFDRRGVEARLGRKAPLPSLRPIPATAGDDAAEPPVVPIAADQAPESPSPKPDQAVAAPALVSGDPGPSTAQARPVSAGGTTGGATGGGGGGGRLTTLSDMLRQAHALLLESQRQGAALAEQQAAAKQPSEH